jgi:hypothetical protein
LTFLASQYTPQYQAEGGSRVPHLALDEAEQLAVAHGAQLVVTVDAGLLGGADDLHGDAGGDLADWKERGSVMSNAVGERCGEDEDELGEDEGE